VTIVPFIARGDEVDLTAARQLLDQVKDPTPCPGKWKREVGGEPENAKSFCLAVGGTQQVI
jgi:hypothetical protein